MRGGGESESERRGVGASQTAVPPPPLPHDLQRLPVQVDIRQLEQLKAAPEDLQNGRMVNQGGLAASSQQSAAGA